MDFGKLLADILVIDPAAPAVEVDGGTWWRWGDLDTVVRSILDAFDRLAVPPGRQDRRVFPQSSRTPGGAAGLRDRRSLRGGDEPDDARRPARRKTSAVSIWQCCSATSAT